MRIKSTNALAKLIRGDNYILVS